MALRAKLPAANPAAVFLVGRDNVVTGREVEPVRQKAHPHRRVEGQRDFIDSGSDELGEERSSLLELLVSGKRLAVSLQVRPIGQLGLELLDAAVHGVNDATR